MEGKAKLSQNKSKDTIEGIIKGLRESEDHRAVEVAQLMQAYLVTAVDM